MTQLQHRPAFDTDDLEPAVRALLDRKAAATRDAPAYVPVGVDRATSGLTAFFADHAPELTVTGVVPMGGGASKEQYVVTLTDGAGPEQRLVLRLDALQGVMESDRLHEHDVLRLLAGHVRVPEAPWVDPEGTYLGRPFLMTRFVPGVAKPTDVANDSVSGLQTSMGRDLRAALGREFVSQLVAIHDAPVRAGETGTLGVPDADPQQAARWQVNWWSRVWQDDKVASHPLVVAVEMWLRDNLPTTDRLSVVHGDYRTGNYLFDEGSRTITAVLDWELAHVGDFHEDLGWAVQRMYSTVEDGQRLVTGLMPREELIAAYEAESGREVLPGSLHFYEVLCAYKSTVATLASSVRAAEAHHSHQDVLLSWLASCGYVFVSRLCDLIEEGPRP